MRTFLFGVDRQLLVNDWLITGSLFVNSALQTLRETLGAAGRGLRPRPKDAENARKEVVSKVADQDVLVGILGT